jgi:hypothetical protein
MVGIYINGFPLCSSCGQNLFDFNVFVWNSSVWNVKYCMCDFSLISSPELKKIIDALAIGPPHRYRDKLLYSVL